MKPKKSHFLWTFTNSFWSKLTKFRIFSENPSVLSEKFMEKLPAALTISKKVPKIRSEGFVSYFCRMLSAENTENESFTVKIGSNFTLSCVFGTCSKKPKKFTKRKNSPPPPHSADLCFKIKKLVHLFICMKFWVTWAIGRKIYSVHDSPQVEIPRRYRLV